MSFAGMTERQVGEAAHTTATSTIIQIHGIGKRLGMSDEDAGTFAITVVMAMFSYVAASAEKKGERAALETLIATARQHGEEFSMGDVMNKPKGSA